MVELVDTQDLKSCGHWPYRFESDRRYQSLNGSPWDKPMAPRVNLGAIPAAGTTRFVFCFAKVSLAVSGTFGASDHFTNHESSVLLFALNGNEVKDRYCHQAKGLICGFRLAQPEK